MSIQTVEERLDELLALRDKIDAEISRLSYGMTAVKKRPRNVLPECGTETAYQRHVYYGEERDDACKEAHARHERLSRIRREARKAAA